MLFRSTIIFLSVHPCISQTIGSGGIHISLETGYSFPMKESFRNNYDQSLFVTRAHVPLSLALGIGYALSPSTDITLSFERKNYHLETSDDISLAVMPALGGLQYRFSKDQIDLGEFSPYVGVSAGAYWAVFSAELLITQDDPTILEVRNETKNYFGYGAQVAVGVDDPLNEHFAFGADVR